MILPVILCGGLGTRLWPLSRQSHPKQLSALIGQHSLLQDTVLRILTLPEVLPPLVICNEEYRFIVAEQLHVLGIENATLILEPCAKNTAPAVAVAALMATPATTLLILPADHHLQSIDSFHAAILAAKPIVEAGYLVTFGIPPTHPETGYGYIKKADPLTQGGYQVAAFVEKPSLAKAKTYLQSQDYFWNSGMFMFHPERYLEELKRYAPEIVLYCEQAVQRAIPDGNFIRLDQAAFNHCPSDSIDYAVMEKSKQVAMIPLIESGWCDLGSWDAVYNQQPQDEHHNVIRGDVIVEQVDHSYVHATHRLVTVLGLSEVIVVETADAVLVAHQTAAQEVKKLVQQLNQHQRMEATAHRLIYRPWGYYEVLEERTDCKVKRIAVHPGKSLSLQLHRFRSEHWIVIQGKAEVTCADNVFILEENQSTYIPALSKHRLKNAGTETLMMIEVQTGSQLDEEDIVRFEDEYGRHQVVQ